MDPSMRMQENPMRKERRKAKGKMSIYQGRALLRKICQNMYWDTICKHREFCAQQDAEKKKGEESSSSESTSFKKGEEGGNYFLKFFFILSSWRFKRELGGLPQGDRANQNYCRFCLCQGR
jgi:hypothetical protein